MGSNGSSPVVNGGVSFWYSSIGLPAPRPGLPGGTDVDVCIVGGGYTGLWTAYYLKKADPGLRVTVLEQRVCGYGASGRNGGWLYNGFAGRGAFARRYGAAPAQAMQRAMDDSVREVVDTAAAEGIDADIALGGVLEVARTPAQLTRMRAFAAEEHAFGESELAVLSAAEATARVRVDGVLGGTWTPHGARIQPAKLVQGLARVVQELGVVIHENTEVTAIHPAGPGRRARAETAAGTVTADYVLRATEGFTAGLRGERRTWLPMNSAMIVTEPLPESFWAATGWQGHEVLGDFAHAYMYAQRTADGRIALGGRGVPYRYGSRTDTDGSTQQRTVDQLRDILHRFFPGAGEARIDQAWAGVLGVPRDWCATVELDRATGLGWAGGYVGSGVTTTNLAGRTLRDLVLGDRTELTALPWVGHTVRRWEVEPLRWLGVHSLYAAYHAADRQEAAGRATTSPIARLADRISGR
ncbi:MULTISPECIES: FAD-binding oxidoreductase [unclassified Kitasatospora]|uniref:NAD(P)/FAD-dependent oxidoreductase n=1 Tax=unclassified Kitasatospora TaxID=2633591 RepID=UPI00070B904C|nr:MULTISPECIES: FAD-binding oxidoreductase [unclassified Kitasatospora]KQV14649.1 FAD-dependent oxidoreductase [Kitasatospora sp. Root107]KRB72465.1 FAD-dependent oxidoreductase [Kitasatospora sp. Root187]